MTWFHVPYRWLPSTFFRNIRIICYDLFIRGPGNVIRWFPVIWLDVDWDHSALLEVMEFKFKNMAKEQESDIWHANSASISKQLRTAELLCKRLRNEDYGTSARKAYPRGIYWLKEVNAVERQDRELLGSIIGKHINKWWT